MISVLCPPLKSLDYMLPPTPPASDIYASKARLWVNLTLRKVRKKLQGKELASHFLTYFWRDEEERSGPAKILKMADMDVVVLQSDQMKNTSFSTRGRPLPDLAYTVNTYEGTLPSSVPRRSPERPRRTIATFRWPTCPKACTCINVNTGIVK